MSNANKYKTHALYLFIFGIELLGYNPTEFLFYLFMYLFLAMLCSIQDLSSPTKGQSVPLVMSPAES